jgi:hypothetical protein
MERITIIQAVSFKTRKVCCYPDNWIKADKTFDLKSLRVGKSYNLEIYQDFETGQYTIRRIV